MQADAHLIVAIHNKDEILDQVVEGILTEFPFIPAGINRYLEATGKECIIYDMSMDDLNDDVYIACAIVDIETGEEAAATIILPRHVISLGASQPIVEFLCTVGTNRATPERMTTLH